MKQLTAKKIAPCIHIKPNVFQPLNSNKYAEYNQIACTEHHKPQYDNALDSFSDLKFFRQIGKIARYQMKYCDVTTGLKATMTNDCKKIQKPSVLRCIPKYTLMVSKISNCGRNVRIFSICMGLLFNRFM